MYNIYVNNLVLPELIPFTLNCVISSVTLDNFAVTFAIKCESKVVFDPKNGSDDDFWGCSVFADSTSV